jgi:hypothetical protein
VLLATHHVLFRRQVYSEIQVSLGDLERGNEIFICEVRVYSKTVQDGQLDVNGCISIIFLLSLLFNYEVCCIWIFIEEELVFVLLIRDMGGRTKALKVCSATDH